VHPGIVLGQLQHRRLLPWSAYAQLRAKIRDILSHVAPTDGFGMLIG
jgi:HTH-type transcriptional regulator/antitoxin HigA